MGDVDTTEYCVICGLPIEPGQRHYPLLDSDDLVWLAHETCVEDHMTRSDED
jgi:hypothetical protein